MSQATPSMTYEEAQKRTSDQITKEEGLIHNRITWMLTFQGFLFAAVVLSAKSDVDPILGPLLRRTIPVVALVSAVLGLIGVRAAYISINNIKAFLAWYEKEYPQPVKPPAFGTPMASKLGRVTSHGLPVLVILAWLYMLQNGIACAAH